MSPSPTVKRPLLRTLTAAYPSATQPRRAHFIESLHRHLQRYYETSLVTPQAASADPLTECRHDVAVHRFTPPGTRSRQPLPKEQRWGPLRLWRYLRRGRRLCYDAWGSETSAGCLLAHWVVPSGFLALPVARRLRLPLVLLAHGTDLHTLARKRGVGALVRRTLNRAACTIVVSRALARDAAQISGRPVTDFPVVPMGIDAEFQRSSQRPEPLPWRLLFVGDTIAAKGAPQLLHAVTTLRRRGVKIELRLASSTTNPNPGQASSLAAAEDGIHWLGALDAAAVQREMSTAHFLVLPSEREGTPLVVQEAIANGLPVIATAVGGIPDLFVGGGAADPLREASGADDRPAHADNNEGRARRASPAWIPLTAPVTASSLTHSLSEVVTEGIDGWRQRCSAVESMPYKALYQSARAQQIATLLERYT